MLSPLLLHEPSHAGPYQMEVVLKNGTTTTYDLDDIKEVNIIER